jgi:hypothetical protein
MLSSERATRVRTFRLASCSRWTSFKIELRAVIAELPDQERIEDPSPRVSNLRGLLGPSRLLQSWLCNGLSLHVSISFRSLRWGWCLEGIRRAAADQHLVGGV